MADFKTDTNNKILQDAVKSLHLRFPVAEIERATGFKKGAISGYLNNKVPVSDAFLQTFSEAFKIDLREFGYTKGLERVEIKNPQQSESFYEKIISQKDAIIDIVLKDNERLRNELSKRQM